MRWPVPGHRGYFEDTEAKAKAKAKLYTKAGGAAEYHADQKRLEGAPKKRRRSSKKAPMSMAFVRRMLESGGALVREERPLPWLCLTVPLKKKSKLGVIRQIHLEMREYGDEGVVVRVRDFIVPKHRADDAIKLLQRLHELG
jgi:hypothetical protein